MLGMMIVEATGAQKAAAASLLRADPGADFSQVMSDALGVDERCHVILIGEEVVGFISYRHAVGYLQHFFVGMRWRCQGVGLSAIHIFFEQLRASGVQSVAMKWIPGSENFWKKALVAYSPIEDADRQVIALH